MMKRVMDGIPDMPIKVKSPPILPGGGIGRHPDPEPTIEGWPLYSGLPQQNEFNPDWDAMAVMVEEQQRMAKCIEELTQRKEWVGLTDDEVDDIGCDFATLGGDIEGKNWFVFYLAIEAKLKEKNA